MKNGHATFLFGALCGLALGLVLGLVAPPSGTSPWVDAKCTGPVWYCTAYVWQTLLAGMFALVGAGLAWIAVHKQMDQAKDLHNERAIQAQKVVEPYVRQLAEITNNLIADASEIMGSDLEINLRLKLMKQGLDAIDRMKFSDVFQRFEDELPPDQSFFLNGIIVGLREVSEAFAILETINEQDEGNLKGATTHACALAQRLAERIGMFEPKFATEFTSLPEYLALDDYEQAPMRSYRNVRRALINTYLLKE